MLCRMSEIHEGIGQRSGGAADLHVGENMAGHGQMAAGDGVQADDREAVAGFDGRRDMLEDG